MVRNPRRHVEEKEQDMHDKDALEAQGIVRDIQLAP